MLQILVYWLQHDLFLTISFQFKKNIWCPHNKDINNIFTPPPHHPLPKFKDYEIISCPLYWFLNKGKERNIQFKYHGIIISLSIISASTIFKPYDQLFRPRITLWGGKSIHIFAPNFVFVTHLDITLLPVNTELFRFRE
jgi:hypothetical protein